MRSFGNKSTIYPDTFTVILKLGFLGSVSSTEW